MEKSRYTECQIVGELGTHMTERLRRDFDCLGIDYNAFYPGETRLQALEILQSAPEVNEYQVFFYHSDHLGSSSFITDVNGDATQHLQYTCTELVECVPFGEDWSLSGAEGHEQNTAAYLSPYTFSGKERDVETSLSYFGARYYEASLSVWLSVDPLSDKYPAWSPYTYTLQNPVVLIDPTGMSAEWFETPDGQIQFDPAIKSQADLKAKGIDGTYLGSEGLRINSQTGYLDFFNADGTISQNAGVFTGQMVEISTEITTDHQRTMANPIVQAIHSGHEEFISGAGQLISNTGSSLSLAGYSLTLTGVGAPLGISLAAIGGVMGAVGTGANLIRHIGNEDAMKAMQTVGFALAGTFLPRSIKVDGQGGEILRQGAALKVDGISRLFNREQ